MKEPAREPRAGTTTGLAGRLKSARLRTFPTAADAARALGLKPVTVRAHESGQNGVSYDDLRKYATLYGVSVESLLYADDETAPTPTAYHEMATTLASTQAQLAYLKDGLRKLMEGLE